MTIKRNVTLVSALYDIGRGQLEGGFGRSFDHYKECFARLLQVDFPMIIFCDTSLEPFIWKYRDRTNTAVIIKSLDTIKNSYFPFYNKIQEIRVKPEWYGQAGWMPDSPQAKLDMYNPITMSKQFLLNDASLMFGSGLPGDDNHAGSKPDAGYLWVDAGLSNTIGNPKDWFNSDFDKKIKSQLKKMLYLGFPYDGQVEIHGFQKQAMNNYAGKDVKYVCRGGLFGGNKASINAINDIYYHLLNDTLNSGFMGTEESIFSIIAHKHPNLCNVQMIESNGLVIKFLDDLKNQRLQAEPEYPLALYFLTFNTPEQFKLTLNSFIKAYPDDFKNNKKYVVDNSTDENAKIEYKKIFEEHDIEIIHEGENLGIQDGRQFVAEHFDKTDHKYYIFHEEDFHYVSKDDPVQNKKGFVRHIPKLFDKSIEIIEEYDFDFLRLTLTEFYGNSWDCWSYKNVPADKRDKYFPPRDDGNEDLRWKTQIDWINSYNDVPIASGKFHISNWPICWTKKGNHQAYLFDPYEHKYEATVMSQCHTYMVEGKLKGGCILASPIEHNRIHFYSAKIRRENKHYKN